MPNLSAHPLDLLKINIFRMKLCRSHFSIISKKLTKKRLQTDGVTIGALLLSIVWVMPSAAVTSVIPTAFATVAPPPPPPSTYAGETATIVGTPGNDNIVGTQGRDVVVALGGDDRVDSLGGNDLVCGGGGNDELLLGGAGDDFIDGGGTEADNGDGRLGSDTCIELETQTSCEA
jgi:Ca2+-binding RTX toxin-like protein